MYFPFVQEDSLLREGRVTVMSSYVVELLDSTCKLDLPSIIECNDIPKNRDEIPFSTIARQYSHLQEIA